MNDAPAIVASWLIRRHWFCDGSNWVNYAMHGQPLTWEQAVSLETVVADVREQILEKK